MDGPEVASSRRLPEVLTKVMDDILAQQRQELQALNEREPLLTARVEQLEKAIAADQQALATYEQQQRQLLEAMRTKGQELASQVLTATGEAQKLENVIEARREDVLRLQQQVRELQADQFRLNAIQQQLQNLLIQLEGDLDRAQDRAELLKQN